MRRYIGETNLNGYTRVLEDHSEDTSTPQFTMRVINTQVTEAVRIARTPRGQLLNNKQEFGYKKIRRFRLKVN